MNLLPPFTVWFIIASTVFNGVMAVAWKKGDWINLLVKIILFVLTFMGLIILYDNHTFF
jgi:hypothetical protein